MLYYRRNYSITIGMLSAAIIIGSLMGAVFHDQGAQRFVIDPFNLADEENNKKNIQTQTNYSGMVFFATMDSFIFTAIAQVVQMPLLKPVFVREQQSKMYSSTSYLFACWGTSTLIMLMYPVVSSLTNFWLLGFND